jgi:membrane-associated phospholipid phosphatase
VRSRKSIFRIRTVALPFIAGLSVYSLVGTAILMLFGKEDTHLLLNSYHSEWLDLFFKYVTHLGDGMIPVFAFLLLLTVRYSWGLTMGIAGLVMGLVVQLLKRSVFAGDHRPAMFFQDGGLPTIDGVELMLHHSFPSGHSATAFCVWLLLALFVKQRWATYAFLGIALLATFSRVYISQHFIQDTIVGAWIGLLIAYSAYVLIVKRTEMNRSSKLNGRFWP